MNCSSRFCGLQGYFRRLVARNIVSAPGNAGNSCPECLGKPSDSTIGRARLRCVMPHTLGNLLVKRPLPIVVPMIFAIVSAGQHASAQTSGNSPTTIAKAGFESGMVEWTSQVYGAQPTIAFEVKHCARGKTVVASFRQRGLRYRAFARARAPRRPLVSLSWLGADQKLDPRSATVCGTFQIQMTGGAGVIASGANHQGNSDWSEVAIDFERRPPA